MKILAPTEEAQTISIVPRRVQSDDVLILTITKDGDKTKESIFDVAPVENGNYFDIEFACSILEEGHLYFLEIEADGELYYRDKIYVTSQQDYTVKHKESQINYTEYNDADDNTYIIR